MKTALTVFLFLLPFLASAQNYAIEKDIPYSANTDTYSSERCKLDVYHPSGNQDAKPVIVWFHGGGLTGGERFIPNELKESGYVVVAPNYRLLPGAEVADCIDDAAAAVAWTFRHIADYGGDPGKVFVSGHSAGGYLTSMVGLDKRWLAKYGVDADSIKALIPFSGQVITHFALRQSKGISELQPVVDEYAPLFHVRKDAPPYIIITGDAETELYGRYEENAYMWRMMKLTGHPDVSIYKLDGYDHGQMAAPAFHILKNVVRGKS